MEQEYAAERQVERDHYFNDTYDGKKRWASYWHQIDELVSVKPANALEIGIGNKLVTNYLRQRGIPVTALDIDPELHPDLIGSVHALPFPDRSFDAVACYEILEHIPYDVYQQALRELHRVSRRHVMISVPDVHRAYKFLVKLPVVGEVKRLLPLPFLVPPKHEFQGQHYWEIGKAGYGLPKILGDMRDAGFHVRKTYRVFEEPYHRFFVLEKKG